jgi:hypothetical protein
VRFKLLYSTVTYFFRQNATTRCHLLLYYMESIQTHLCKLRRPSVYLPADLVLKRWLSAISLAIPDNNLHSSLSSLKVLTLKVSPQQEGDFIEQIDLTKLVKLINSALLNLTFKDPSSRTGQNGKQRHAAYLAKFHDGIVPVTYQRNENNPYGRCNPD